MAVTYTQVFGGQSTWSVDGLEHDLGSEDIVFGVWDSNNPRRWMEPEQALVHPSTFDFVASFGAGFPGNGKLVLVAADYAETFSAASTWTVLGSTHGLGSKNLIPMCWSADTPRQWIIPEGVTVDATSFNVEVTWGVDAVAGTLALVEGQYAEAFTATDTATATGLEHGRGTDGVLTAVYDNATPARWIGPGQVTVHQSSFDVEMTLGEALSGLFVVHGEVSSGTGPGGELAAGYQVMWRRRRAR